MAKITGTSLADLLNGTARKDTIYGRGGDDTIYGLGGDDTIFADEGSDSVWGGAGNDTIYGDAFSPSRLLSEARIFFLVATATSFSAGCMGTIGSTVATATTGCSATRVTIP